ncbi:MAG: phosphate transport system substrate-binding protein [Verrucomicrobiales bacterium]|jgi:phosphate transport system substrate-binding protein
MKTNALMTIVAAGLSLNASAQDKIVIRGSDTLGAKMVPQLVEAYKAEGNKVEFDVAAEGSSAAFTNLENGTCQIGMSSRDAKEE